MSQPESQPRRRRPGLRRSVPGPNEVRFAQALGVVLRVLRQCRRLEAKKLAAVTGSGYIQLTRYEAGEALPTMTKLLELLTAMGVSFDTFAQMQVLANRLVGLGALEVLKDLGYLEVTPARGLTVADPSVPAPEDSDRIALRSPGRADPQCHSSSSATAARTAAATLAGFMII